MQFTNYSDILNAIGIAESSPTGERVSLRSLITAGQKRWVKGTNV